VVFTLFGLLEPSPAEEALEAIYAARVAQEQKCDPAPCKILEDFARPTTPRRVKQLVKIDRKMLLKRFSGAITTTTVRLYQRVVDAEATVVTHEGGVFETVCKLHTAKMKREAAAIAFQWSHLAKLKFETAKRKSEANQAWRALLGHLHRSKILSKEIARHEKFLLQLRRHGFPEPESEVEIMRWLGISDTEIEQVRVTVLENFDPQKAPRTVRRGCSIGHVGECGQQGNRELQM
jgi:hypothetical protein